MNPPMVVVNTLAKTEIRAFWKDSNLFFYITNGASMFNFMQQEKYESNIAIWNQSIQV